MHASRSPAVILNQCRVETWHRLVRTRCTARVWTVACGQMAVIASGNPLNPRCMHQACPCYEVLSARPSNCFTSSPPPSWSTCPERRARRPGPLPLPYRRSRRPPLDRPTRRPRLPGMQLVVDLVGDREIGCVAGLTRVSWTRLVRRRYLLFSSHQVYSVTRWGSNGRFRCATCGLVAGTGSAPPVRNTRRARYRGVRGIRVRPLPL